ncbi:type II and III secretion system protein, partial [Verrucomicrobiales bacterium]|nr:type II and III secretion system protein [Verrucomicrobiales bacterium]
GVTFPPGGSASFNPRTSQLIVRTTQDQMELAEIFLDTLTSGVEKQIFITSRFIEISQEDGKELGFDWLLGPFNIGTAPKVFGSGGVPSNAGNLTATDFAFSNPDGTTIAGNPVTAGLRSGGNALSADSIDGLISDAAGSTQDLSAVAPSIFGIAGVFTDPQFQVMIRALRQKKGVDLMTAPSVMARSGQRAKIEVIREFIYPTEYDPPEIPNQVGTTGITGGDGSSTGTFPVTPATPTAFETRNTGVTLEVDPVLGADNFTIDLNLSPEVVEFEGFINYGSPISSAGFNALGQAQQVVITENRIEMPVFNTRKVTTQVTIWDQQTVALGGLIREDVQDVEDKVPFLGDLPIFGRLFRNNVELHLKRNLTIFVRAEIQDPAGLKINNRFIGTDVPEGVDATAPAP